MADVPTSDMLAEFIRLAKEANEVSRSHEEYMTLMFMGAVDLERARMQRQERVAFLEKMLSGSLIRRREWVEELKRLRQ